MLAHLKMSKHLYCIKSWSQSTCTAFGWIFSGIPHSTIFTAPKYAHQIRKIWPNMPITIVGARIGRASYGWEEYPWKDRAKSSPDVDLGSIWPPGQKLSPNQMHNGYVISRYGSLPRVSVKVGPTWQVSLDLDLTVNVKKCQKLTHYIR